MCKLTVVPVKRAVCVSLPPGYAMIRYSNLGSAMYAKEKLNGFEYPPGNRIQVFFQDDGERCVSATQHLEHTQSLEVNEILCEEVSLTATFINLVQICLLLKFVQQTDRMAESWCLKFLISFFFIMIQTEYT